MDGLNEFLRFLQEQGRVRGNFLGLLNVLIGRRIQDSHGAVILQGLTWRVLAALLKKVRWDKEAVRELGLDPKQLPARDRERFWYAAISQAHVDSPQAVQEGNRFSEVLAALGYVVGPGPKQ
jgi:hypothetical protein